MSDKRGSQVSHGQETGTAQQPFEPQQSGQSAPQTRGQLNLTGSQQSGTKPSTGDCPSTETSQPVSEAEDNGHKADETTQKQHQGVDDDEDSDDSDVSEMYDDEEFEDEEDEEDEEELSNGKGKG